jgi:hypothetical protein
MRQRAENAQIHTFYTMLSAFAFFALLCFFALRLPARKREKNAGAHLWHHYQNYKYVLEIKVHKESEQK